MEIRPIAFGTAEYEAAVALRNLVLRAPLGLAFTAEEIADEPHHFHLGAWAGEELVGILLLRPMGEGRVKMRQVAVAPAEQGRGVGAQLVTWAEAYARRQGFHLLYAHARVMALRFYQRAGYAVVGEEFIEATVPHRRIEKVL